MSRLVFTEVVTQGLERCRLFLVGKPHSGGACRSSGQAVKHQFILLETQPEIGRSVDDLPEPRELMIPFGNSGYVALYRHEVIADTVYVLAFRHQKQAGY